MRAALFHEFGGPEVIGLDEVPVPEPAPGEVRLRVHAAAMNHLDLWARRGLPFEIPMPHIGGSDIAGEVEALGPDVIGVAIGARVVVDPSIGYDWYDTPPGTPRGPPLRVIGEHTQGGLAEYCVVPAANLLELPDGVDFETAAAAALNGVTAWHGLVNRGGLRGGESVLVTGASGGVASMAVQMARSVGARVFAVTRGERNVERLRSLGADVVYDREQTDFSRELWRETGKRGVDLVFDSVGEATWDASLRCLAPTGRLVVYGATTGPHVGIDLRRVFWRQLSVIGTTMGPPDAFRTAMRLVFEGEVRPVVDRVLGLEGVRLAHELLEAGDVFGKIVIRVSGEGD